MTHNRCKTAACFRCLIGSMSLVALAARAELFSNVLSNAGFEAGSSDTDIAGWTRFGNAYRYATPDAHSGNYAVAAWGNWWPAGEWNGSGLYQDYPTTEGQIWEAAVWAHVNIPLQGRAFAGINLEFFNAASQCIFSGTSAHKITANTPTNQWFRLTAKAQAIPNTVRVRAIPLLVQSPDFESGAVWLDDAELYLNPTGRLDFAGRSWKVLDGISAPGPNNYYSTNCCWVDTNGWLHMAVRQVDGVWCCGFMEHERPLGFGVYSWRIGSRVDLLNSNLVAGLFTYALEPEYGTNQNEIDIEISHALPDTQSNCLLLTVQPYTIPGNTYQHLMVLTNDRTTHRFCWRPDRVDWQSYYGHAPAPDEHTAFIAGWRFERHGIPIETNEHPFINLWLFRTNRPTGTQGLEMVIHDFDFTPFDGFLIRDDFRADGISNLWQVLGSSVAATNGRLVMQPSGTNRAALITTNWIHRNERGCRYVFSARLAELNTAASGVGEDIRLSLALLGATNAPEASPAHARLECGFDTEANCLTWRFFTRTNSADRLWFWGVTTNLADILAAGTMELRLELDPMRYRIESRTADGMPITIHTNTGTAAGLHDLGDQLDYGYWLIGAENTSPAVSGQVAWAGAAVGIAAQADTVNAAAISISERQAIVSAAACFDTRYTLWRATNLPGVFLGVASNIAALAPTVWLTDHVENAAAYYRLGAE